MRVPSIIALTIALIARPAHADRYWVAYEGDDFPENQGWTRGMGGNGAERAIQAGILELDGLASNQIYDYYEKVVSTVLLNGDLFVLQWRVRVVENDNREDISVALSADDRYTVGLRLGESSIRSVFGEAMTVDFQPGVFHSFELQSPDMRSFSLYIDGEIAMTGSFSLTASSSRVAWGDGVQGAASLSQWDYVRFGVVPEPMAAEIFSVGWVVLLTRRSC